MGRAIANIYKTANYHFFKIRRIRKYLIRPLTTIHINAFVLSRIDYSLLFHFRTILCYRVVYLFISFIYFIYLLVVLVLYCYMYLRGVVTPMTSANKPYHHHHHHQLL